MDFQAALNIFDLSDSFTKEELKKTYRKLALKYHPDRQKNTSNPQMMQKVNEAYDQLKNYLNTGKKKRKKHARTKHKAYGSQTGTYSTFHSYDFVFNLMKAPDIQIHLHEVISQKKPKFDTLDPAFPQKITDKLEYSQFYSHQVKTINYIRDNKNVILSTPTSSGKSYTYLLPFFEEVIKDSNTTGIFIFPMKALSNDQMKIFEHFDIGTYARYDGDVCDSDKKQIRKEPPNALITNPDSIHYSLLRTSKEWKDFLSNLKFIVLDEVHTYNGFFGSNVSNILFRLLKLAEKLGANPRIVCTSATVENGKRFAEKLAWRDFEIITDSGAGQSEKHIIMARHKAALFFLAKLCLAMQKSHKQTIVFCNSRLTVTTAKNFTRSLIDKDSEKFEEYHAGHPDSQRRKVENRFKNKEVEVLFTTSAMELGIDIGDLDVCILYGLPDTNNEIWQRLGRAGRDYKSPSMGLIVYTGSAIDRYYFQNPDKFMETRNKPESPIIFPKNKEIRSKHLQCGYFEGLKESDLDFKDKSLWKKIDKNSDKAGSYLRIPIRNSWGMEYDLINESGNKIGTIEYERIYRDLHYGAVFQYGNKYYKRSSIDFDNRKVQLDTIDEDTDLTRPSLNHKVEINDIIEEKTWDFDGKKIIVGLGKIKVRSEIKGYVILDDKGNYKDYRQIRYPDYLQFKTKAIWVSFTGDLSNWKDLIPIFKNDVQESVLHSTQHLLIRTFVQKGHCDWNDIDGVTLSIHPHFNRNPAMFLYDNCKGGIKLAETLYNELDNLLQKSYDLISTCPCNNEYGCRACLIMKRFCNKFNKNLNKELTAKFLSVIAQKAKSTKNIGSPLLKSRQTVKRGEYDIGDKINGDRVIEKDEDELTVLTKNGPKYYQIIEENSDED